MGEEFEESLESIKQKVATLATWLTAAKHAVVHTGAGISCASGIPDFRGPTGVWTLKELNQAPQIDIEFEEAMPTLAHMALVELSNRNVVKYIVSQNVDGLHLRSGIPRAKLSELHGNIYLDVCEKCDVSMLRDFDAAQDADDDHYTGRMCEAPGCGGKLLDSIIDFGEDLPVAELQRAQDHSKESDLAIVLGSSLTVTPACNLPIRAKKNKGGKLVIVNLQKTEHDSKADLRIFGKIDVVMALLMDALALTVPVYSLDSKKIVVGNTSEVAEDGRVDWSVFLCGEWGYVCPLIERIELDIREIEATEVDEVCHPLIGAEEPPAQRGRRGKRKAAVAVPEDRILRFSGKTQGDLLRGHLEGDDTAVSRAKRPKTKAKTAAPRPSQSVEFTVHWKFYCNALPTRFTHKLNLTQGMHESVMLATFGRPTNGQTDPRPAQLVQTHTKPLVAE